MEEKINFISETFCLEGMYEKTDSRRGVVITHPHPLYGGDMYNPVVETIRNAFRKKGYTTLRFNFRGTGNSQGYFDNGSGEQQDVRSACSFLAEKGIESILLVGYSFGAWVNASMKENRAPVERMIMVSPPVGFIAFASIGAIPALTLVTTGSRDDIAPEALIQEALPGWNMAARLKIIEGADHFYTGCLEVLEAVLAAEI